MTAGSGAPTMADVAQRAGVSHQTVSRVLNDAAAVRPETREAVLRAIAELGYRRNQAARALVTRRSGLIGVIVDELRLYGPASTVSSVAQAAREAGYGITLDLLWHVTGSSVAAALEHQLSQAVEAVVLVAAHGEMPRAGVLSGLSVPVIALDGFLGDDTPTAGVDQRAGGVMATRHLLELGHRRLAHIRGPQAWPQADARLAGFTEALAQAGLPLGPVITGDWSPKAGYEACLRVLGEFPSTTALFVANDQMAMGALRALAEAGKRVPEDV
jgi:DNA-binding LacI/PurR family transcriptional regulator